MATATETEFLSYAASDRYNSDARPARRLSAGYDAATACMIVDALSKCDCHAVASPINRVTSGFAASASRQLRVLAGGRMLAAFCTTVESEPLAAKRSKYIRRIFSSSYQCSLSSRNWAFGSAVAPEE